MQKPVTHQYQEAEWRQLCSTEAEQAQRACGLSHDYYVQLFSTAIDKHAAQLQPEHRVTALDIARDWEYASPADRDETQRMLADQGLCMHGIDPDCCSAGCGDLYHEVDAPSFEELEEEDAFAEGFKARYDGFRLADNPHDAHQARGWVKGWSYALDQQKHWTDFFDQLETWLDKEVLRHKTELGLRD